MILLDTNVVVRLMTGEGRIGATARQKFDGISERCSSVMVQWELAMLASKGRLSFHRPIDAWMKEAADLLCFTDVMVTAEIARDAGGLPGTLHGDPCDRIMIATARALGCPLITVDSKIIDYAEQGHVMVIDARR